MGRIGKGWAVAALVALGGRPASPQATLQVPDPPQAFIISPHAGQEPGPAMPAIPALLVGAELQAGAAIQWRGRVQYSTRQRNPLVLTDAFQIQGGTACPAELFRHPADPGRGADREWIRGGSLRLTATVFQAGGSSGPVALDGLQLRLGDQPDRDRVRERLTLGAEVFPHGPQLDGPTLTAWIRAIACQESRWRQNAVSEDPEHYQALGEPLMNRGGDGGIGIMQRTPYGIERAQGHRIQDWLWDWTANADEGLRLFRAEKLRGSAAGFADRVARCEAFRLAVEATHRHRESQALPALSRIRVPPFTAEQLLRDAVRGYNGYGGRDALGLPLHQYRLKTQATAFGLALEVSAPEPDPADLLRPMAWAVWEEVPASHRPIGGDRMYVSHVAGRLHQPCGD
jgi:hypothetical protein